MNFYTAYICGNGHVISAKSGVCPYTYCPDCGAKIISKCPSCGSVIRGVVNDSWSYVYDFTVPAYCPDCGKPFPWTVAAIETASALLDVAPELAPEHRELFRKLIPDAVSETPRTPLAAAACKRLLEAADSVIAEGLVQFALKCGCDLFRSSLGL